MATANAAATLEQANDFDTDYGTATLTILAGATTLATHTLAGFVTSNSGADGVATANAIADATIAANGTADGATLTAAGKTYTLTLARVVQTLLCLQLTTLAARRRALTAS